MGNTRGGAVKQGSIWAKNSFLVDHVGVVDNAAYLAALAAGSAHAMRELEIAACVLPDDWASKGYMQVDRTERAAQLKAAPGLWPRDEAGELKEDVTLPRCSCSCPSIIIIIILFEKVIYVILICLTILIVVLFPSSHAGTCPIVPVWPQSPTSTCGMGACVGVSFRGLVVAGRTHPNALVKSLLGGAPGNDADAPVHPEAIDLGGGIE
ncbi:MAG: hypothetical protein J3K34DRAFT_522110 [Monoraphidium minutum]|nr:MAG: hypothetical protein J3K34DRAFT_522110 [Monoraphidium minutum]